MINTCFLLLAFHWIKILKFFMDSLVVRKLGPSQILGELLVSIRLKEELYVFLNDSNLSKSYLIQHIYLHTHSDLALLYVFLQILFFGGIFLHCVSSSCIQPYYKYYANTRASHYSLRLLSLCKSEVFPFHCKPHGTRANVPTEHKCMVAFTEVRVEWLIFIVSLVPAVRQSFNSDINLQTSGYRVERSRQCRGTRAEFILSQILAMVKQLGLVS